MCGIFIYHASICNLFALHFQAEIDSVFPTLSVYLSISYQKYIYRLYIKWNKNVVLNNNNNKNYKFYYHHYHDYFQMHGQSVLFRIITARFYFFSMLQTNDNTNWFLASLRWPLSPYRKINQKHAMNHIRRNASVCLSLIWFIQW